MKRLLLFVLFLAFPSMVSAAPVTYRASGEIIEGGRRYEVTGTITLSEFLRDYETGEAVDASKLDEPMQLGYYITRYRLRIGGYDFHGRSGSLYFEGPWRDNSIGGEEWLLNNPSGDLEALQFERWILGPNFWFLDHAARRLNRDQVLEINELPPMIILWSHHGIFSTRASPASHILLRAEER